MTFANQEQAEFWSELAPTWAELGERLERFGGLPGQLAMERLGLRAGDRVLEIGCGTGTSTRELAAVVGTGGTVIGVDIAEGMLEEARKGRPANVELRHADVQEADLGTHVFDAAFSRFGVMFFSDPVRAFANVRSALRPSGVLSFACWGTLTDNEWMLVPGVAAVSVTGQLPAMPGPGEPGPFSLDDPARVTNVLEQAGFSDIDVLRHDDHVAIPERDIDTIADTSLRVGAVREMLKDASGETHAKVRSAIGEALRSRVESGEVPLARSVLLVKASA